MNARDDTMEEETFFASPADDAIDAATHSQQEALESIETAGSTIIFGLTRVQREIAGFVSERISQDLEAQRAMLRCKSLTDIQSIQTRFLKTAVDQYAAETNRLWKLGGEFIVKNQGRGA
jgi:hypothetical protein